MKMNKETFELEIGSKTLKITINDWAIQAGGSCLVQYGETVVLANATMSQGNTEGKDFFPLTTEYAPSLF